MTHRLVRVKRKANEDFCLKNKKCRLLGTCETSDEEEIKKILAPQLDLQQNYVVTEYSEFCADKQGFPKFDETKMKFKDESKVHKH